MSTEKRAVIRLFLAICCVISCNGLTDLPKPLAGTNTYQLRMPGVTPQKDDDYVCTAYKLEPDQQLYITRFRVEGTAERAHHMILSGCGNIPSAAVENSSWNCGHHGTCSGGSTILYAWAKNAPGTQLPPSVGFRIGGGENSKIKYLVVQVHYAHRLPHGERDYTGLDLEITSQPQKYIAGILLMLAMPNIPPLQAVVNSDACCPVTMPAPIHVFAARVHAHGLGRVITGYKYNPKTEVAELMVKGNPQWPQAFYPTSREFLLDNGDEIMVRCTYSSLERTTTTMGGGSSSDEMCNVYLMYYTDAINGTGYQSCGYACNAQQNRAFPSDSIEPLPYNPVLEAYALHGNKNTVNNQAATDSISNEQQYSKDIPSVFDLTKQTVQADVQETQDRQLISQDPMTLNRVYYKQVFDDAHQHHQQQQAEQQQAEQLKQKEHLEAVQSLPATGSKSVQLESRQNDRNEESATTEQQGNENKFWSMLFFYRRFFS